jgi:hypothetical protein
VSDKREIADVLGELIEAFDARFQVVEALATALLEILIAAKITTVEEFVGLAEKNHIELKELHSKLNNERQGKKT